MAAREAWRRAESLREMQADQLPLTRNQPAILRRVAREVRTSCGKDSLRKMIMVPKVGFTVAITDLPVVSKTTNSPPSQACQSSFRYSTVVKTRFFLPCSTSECFA